MNSRERVRRTVTFSTPDRIPSQLWVLPGTFLRYGEALSALLEQFPGDFGADGFQNPLGEDQLFQAGRTTDAWGSTWMNSTPGLLGQVEKFPLDDWSNLAAYRPPLHLADKGFEKVDETIQSGDRFVVAPALTLFHRMNWLRNSADLYMDLADGRPEVFQLRDLIHEFNLKRLQETLGHPYDAVMMMDDWGSQQALLISPKMWRKHFKGYYRQLCEIAQQAGKLIFFHSDGYILDIIEDLIEIGVKALNCQVWCMGAEELSRRFKGRLCFWGELDRQRLLPHGTPEQIKVAARKMVDLFWTGQGGLIHQAEAGPDVPLENIEALLETWEKLTGTAPPDCSS